MKNVCIFREGVFGGIFFYMRWFSCALEENVKGFFEKVCMDLCQIKCRR